VVRDTPTFVLLRLRCSLPSITDVATGDDDKLDEGNGSDKKAGVD
jgi:hypothetical protein